MHRLAFFAAALAFGVAGTAVAETEGATAEQTQVAAPASVGPLSPEKRREDSQQKATLQKKTNRSPNKAPLKTSNFVRLSNLILDDAFALTNDSELAAGVFDSAMAARLFATGETRWAFGQIAPSRHLPNVYPEDDPTIKAIEIQSLDLAFGPFNPLSTAIYRPPVRGLLLPDGEDTAPFGGLSGIASQPTMGRDISEREQGQSRSAGTGSDPLTYRYAVDSATSVKAGVAYVPDLDDTKGNTKFLLGPEDEGSSSTLSGVNLSLGASYRALTLTGGYARALDNRTFSELALDGKDSDPIVWNSEIAYSTELLRRETTLALGYQKSSDSLYSYLPEERYKTKASMALSGSTTFSLEYYQDRDTSLKNGEEDGYGITTRIGFDF